MFSLRVPPKLLLRTVLAAALMLGSASPARSAAVPTFAGPVNDTAAVLSGSMRDAVTALLREHKRKTGNQIAVLTVPSLDGENIEEYAVDVFEHWKLGQKGKDNGVLLVIATKDRKMRIEVGYGLEPTLTDALSGRIIRQVITPRFKAGDFNNGINLGVNAIIQVLETGTLSELPEPEATAAPAAAAVAGTPQAAVSSSGVLVFKILFLLFIFGFIGLLAILGLRARGRGSWVLYFFLMPFLLFFPVGVIGWAAAVAVFALYAIGFPLAKVLIREGDELNLAGNVPPGALSPRLRLAAWLARKFPIMVPSKRSGSSWSSSGSSSFASSDSFSSSDSSDSDSGGGGSSGGGGASGDW